MHKKIFIFLSFVLCLRVTAADTKSIDSLKLLVKQANDTSKIRHLNAIALIFFKTVADDSAFKYAQKVLKFQNQFRDSSQNLASYYIISTCLISKGNYDSALVYAFQGMDIANKLNNLKYKYLLLACIADSYERKHNTEKAVGYFLQCLSLAEQQLDSIKIAQCYASIGNIYLYNNNYDMSLLSIRTSLNILLAKHKTDTLSFDYSALGNSYSNLGILMVKYFTNKQKPIVYLDSALFYFSKGIGYTRNRANARVTLESLLINAADVYNIKGDYAKAIALLEEASMLVSQTQNYTHKVVVFINFGDAYRGLNNINASIQNLNMAIELAFKKNLKPLISDAYLSLSKTYEKINKYDEALYNYKIFSNYNDTLLIQRNSGSIFEIMTKFETDKKEAAIKLLTKDNEIQQQEIRRQKLVRNIVFAGLFLISGLLFLLFGRYKLTKQLNIKLDKANSLIYNKNRLVMDSIDYAERIQQLILPPLKNINRHFADSFAVFIPKDIISGDIYWFKKQENIFLIAAVDCTGHGVPGALMSMVAYNLLNRAVNTGHFPDAVSVVTNLNVGLKNFLAKTVDRSSIRDGMDIAVCSIDLNTLKLTFSGAKNSMYLIRNNALTELKSANVSLGDPVSYDHIFSGQELQLQKGDWLYLFTDGYADQKGGPDNKKFYYQAFKDLLIRVNNFGGPAQKQYLENIFNEWKSGNDQLDDVLVIGIKV